MRRLNDSLLHDNPEECTAAAPGRPTYFLKEPLALAGAAGRDMETAAVPITPAALSQDNLLHPSSPTPGCVARAPSDGTAGVLAVVGGRGGAGASIFAAAVALTVLSRNANALVIDCDPLGSGWDLLLPKRSHGNARLTLLSGPHPGAAPEPDAVAAMIEASRQAGRTVICDLPRHFDHTALVALEHADLTVVIVPAEVRACATTKILAARLADLGHAAKLIVRGPSPTDLRPHQVAHAVGLPLLSSMRPEPSLAKLIDRGQFTFQPDNPLAKAARATLRALTASLAAPRGH